MYSKSCETVFSFTVNTLNWLKNLGCAMCPRSVKAPPESSSVARIRWPSSETFQRPQVAFRVMDSNTFKYFKSCRKCASSHLEESLPNSSPRSNPSSFKSVTSLQQKQHHRFRSLRFHILKFPWNSPALSNNEDLFLTQPFDSVFWWAHGQDHPYSTKKTLIQQQLPMHTFLFDSQTRE